MEEYSYTVIRELVALLSYARLLALLSEVAGSDVSGITCSVRSLRSVLATVAFMDCETLGAVLDALEGV